MCGPRHRVEDRLGWASGFGFLANATFQEFDSGDDFFGVDIVEEARGQLNASIRYAVNDSWDVGLEVINLTQADAEQSCVNEGALLCFQDLTDRRMLLGASYRF